MLMPGDVVLALSYSGETPEVVRLLEFARQRSIRTIAMTGVAGLLGRAGGGDADLGRRSRGRPAP